MMEKEKKQQKREQQRHRCENCSSTFCYLRVKSNQWVCRSCGNIEKIKEEKE